MQVNIDFSRRPVLLDDKKTELLSFRCPDTFKNWLQQIAKAKNTTIAELLYEYAVSGMQKDLGLILMVQGRGDKRLKDLL